MSPRFALGREIVLCVAEVVNRSLKADCTDFKKKFSRKHYLSSMPPPSINNDQSLKSNYSCLVIPES